LVWLYDDDHGRPHEAARAVIHSGGELVVSTNVLGELFVAFTKNRGTKVPLATIAEAARKVSWWDALNWSSAVAAKCDEFVGADRPSRPVIDDVRFVNPFV